MSEEQTLLEKILGPLIVFAVSASVVAFFTAWNTVRDHSHAIEQNRQAIEELKDEMDSLDDEFKSLFHKSYMRDLQ